MADVHFSEFSYGFAVTYETVNLLNRMGFTVKKAPEMPSLIAEGRGAGYDVKVSSLKGIVFLQFKLSDYMHGKNATARADVEPSAPYYRFYTRGSASSNQHNDLLALESKGQEVYYIAPIFNGLDRFDELFSRNEVIENSVLITPKSVGVFSDSKNHQVCFDGASLRKFYSEVRDIDGVVMISDFLRETSWINRRFNDDFDPFRKAFQDMIAIKGLERMQEVLIERFGQNYFEAAAYVSRNWFSLTMFAIYQRDDNHG